uniref:Uncharacterized protein n=1 Tax=Lates calcarifer TaxID=8187 RepID=A0A4W6EV76_LATCA
MAQVDQGWRGDKDDLEDPEANVRDGEGPVVADVLTTRLLSVADETRLLVAPNESPITHPYNKDEHDLWAKQSKLTRVKQSDSINIDRK